MVPNFTYSKVAYFWSSFDHYGVLANSPWNPKQQRRSKKNSIVADFTTNLILPVAESAYNSQNAQFGLVMNHLFEIVKAALVKSLIRKTKTPSDKNKLEKLVFMDLNCQAD